MNKGKPGRHAPAFILLILAMGPNHGLGILAKMDEIAHGHRLDTAVVYRVLKKLEAEAYILSDWQESEAGPRKKVYSITEKGKQELTNFKVDIDGAIKRLTTFVSLYNDLEV